MKILVFEYITGGGFNKQELPGSLAGEGRLMLEALLENLSSISGIEVTVMLDWRVIDRVNTHGASKIVITPAHDTDAEFAGQAARCDAAWPVAPEFDGILEGLCLAVEALGKALLTSSAGAVALTADKFKTFEHLSRHHIATVATRLLEDCRQYQGECIVKSIDGAGCADSYLVTDREDFDRISARLRGTGGYIVQPHVHGKKTSLCCLFKGGRAWLLCANLQQFEIVGKQYHLSGITVNVEQDLSRYQPLADSLALALPDLWGYAGVDLIETDERLFVLEINPRLTTSVTGIAAALGVNIAGLVLQLIEGDPRVDPARNRPITIKIKQESDEI